MGDCGSVQHGQFLDVSTLKHVYLLNGATEKSGMSEAEIGLSGRRKFSRRLWLQTNFQYV